MNRMNCWELKGCGREPGGAKEVELGVCAAAIADHVDGLNHGHNGGRICWAVTGTLCGGKVQGSFAEKRLSCMTCEVFERIRNEEGSSEFKLLIPGQVYMPAPPRDEDGADSDPVEKLEPVHPAADIKKLPPAERLAREIASAYWHGVADTYIACKGTRKSARTTEWIGDQANKSWRKYLEGARKLLADLIV